MDTQRHNNKCGSLRRQSHEVAHEHQKSLKRKTKCRNRVVLQRHKNLNGGTDIVMFTTLKFEVFMHPVYSPDLSACDYDVFGSLKKFLEGKCFSTDKEVKKVVKEWMLQVSAEFWRGVMYKPPEHWQKCIDKDGDYVRGDQKVLPI